MPFAAWCHILRFTEQQLSNELRVTETGRWEIVGCLVSLVEERELCWLIDCRYGCDVVEATAVSHAAVQEL